MIHITYGIHMCNTNGSEGEYGNRSERMPSIDWVLGKIRDESQNRWRNWKICKIFNIQMKFVPKKVSSFTSNWFDSDHITIPSLFSSSISILRKIHQYNTFDKSEWTEWKYLHHAIRYTIHYTIIWMKHWTYGEPQNVPDFYDKSNFHVDAALLVPVFCPPHPRPHTYTIFEIMKLKLIC